MLSLRCLLLASIIPVASIASQSVLTVGLLGQFADVPAAVAAAQPGDTVRLLPWPHLQLFTAPVITRGLTLDGGGTHGLVGLTVISGVPAGEAVVMYGFRYPSNQVVEVRVVDCDGRVHLDSLWTVNSTTGVWPSTSIEVIRSGAVSLRAVATHGSPAVSVVDSTLTIDHCMLGRRAGGIQAGGRCVEGLRSTILISQPDARAGDVPVSAIFVDQCDVTIAGRALAGGSGSIYGGLASPLQFPALEGINSTLTLSPAVFIVGAVAGFTATMREPPYNWAYSGSPAGTASLYTYGPVGDIGIAALTLPVVPVPSPFGDLWVDPGTLAAYPFVLNSTGSHYLIVAVPIGIPVGSAWTLQGVVLTNGNLDLTLPSTFAVRN